MPKPYRAFETGTAAKFTWTGSVAPLSLMLNLKTASETVVRSVAGVQSAGGCWFAFASIPDSMGSYPADLVAEWTATASTHISNTTTFTYRMPFRVMKTTAYGHGRD
jgi:hypothetical protein